MARYAEFKATCVECKGDKFVMAREIRVSDRIGAGAYIKMPEVITCLKCHVPIPDADTIINLKRKEQEDVPSTDDKES